MPSAHPEKCGEIPFSVRIQPSVLQKAKRAAKHDRHESTSEYIIKLIKADLAVKAEIKESLDYIFADSDD